MSCILIPLSFHTFDTYIKVLNQNYPTVTWDLIDKINIILWLGIIRRSFSCASNLIMKAAYRRAWNGRNITESKEIRK